MALSAQIPALAGYAGAGVTIAASSEYPNEVGGGGHRYAWNACDGTGLAWFANTNTGSLTITFATPRTISQYAVTGWSSADPSNTQARAPKSWTLYAVVGGLDVALDSHSGILTGDGVATVSTIASPVATTTYRLDASTTADLLTIREVQMFADTLPGWRQVTRPCAPSLDCLAGPSPTIPVNDYAGSSYWLGELANHTHTQAALAASGDRVIVLGDSLVACLDASAIAEGCVAFSIGGDSLVGVMNRLPSYTALHACRAGMLLAMHNDIAVFGRSAAEIEGYLSGLFAWMTGAWVIFTIPPTATPAWNTQFQAVNAWIRAALAGVPGKAVADLWPAMIGSDGLVRPELVVDGTHFSAAGAAIVQQVGASALATL